MTGYELLGMAMRGEIEDGTMFARVEKISRYIIKFGSSMFTDGYNKAVTWSIYNLNAEWELTVEKKPKPQLDDWEKELLEKALDHGYTHIKIKDYFVWLIVENGKNAFGSSALAFGFDSLRNNAYKNKNTSIKWLLGREE